MYVNYYYVICVFECCCWTIFLQVQGEGQRRSAEGETKESE